MTPNIKIDLKDKKILTELAWNARITNSSLSKKVGLSKKGVEYRIKRLEEKKIIKGYYPVVNLLALGFIGGTAYFKFRHYNKKAREDIARFIRKSKWLNTVSWLSGKYDFSIGAWPRTMAGFKGRMMDFCAKFGKHIALIDYSFVSKFHLKPSTFTKQHIILGEKILREPSYPIEIDEIEEKIIWELEKNSRESIIAMAHNAGTTAKKFTAKMKKLEKKEAILGYRAIVDKQKLGIMPYRIFLSLEDKGYEFYEKLHQHLEKKTEIYCVVTETGISDLAFDAEFKDHNEFLDFMKVLTEKYETQIKNYDYIFIEEVDKFTCTPINLDMALKSADKTKNRFHNQRW